MAWIEVHQQLVSHPKMLDVADDLEICAPQAIGHLLCLWMWALEYAEDGDLSRYSVRRIEQAAQWTGPAGALVEALQRRGWLDEWQVHDWWEYAGKLIERRRSDAERKAQARTGQQERPGRAAVQQPAAVAEPEPVAQAAAFAEQEQGTVEVEVVVPPRRKRQTVSGGRPADVRGMSGGRPADVRRNPTITVPNNTRQKITQPPPPPDASEMPPEVGDVGEGVVVVVDGAFDQVQILSPEARQRAMAGWLAVHGEPLRPADVLAWGKYLEKQNKGKRNGAVLGPGLVVTALEAGRPAPKGCYASVEDDVVGERYVLE